MLSRQNSHFAAFRAKVGPSFTGDNLYTCRRTLQRKFSSLWSLPQRFRAPKPHPMGSRCIDRIQNRRLSLSTLHKDISICLTHWDRGEVLHLTECHCDRKSNSASWNSISSIEVRKSQHLCEDRGLVTDRLTPRKIAD